MHNKISDVDVAIIGGGVVGCILSYLLAREGIEVCVLEKGELCSGASDLNTETVYGQLFLTTDSYDPTIKRQASMIKSCFHSLDMWEAISRELGAKSRIVQGGTIMVVGPEMDMNRIRQKITLDAILGGKTRIISRDEIKERAPGITNDCVAGLLAPNEGKLDLHAVLTAIFSAMQDLGVQSLTSTRVDDINIGTNQTIITTEHGDVVCRRLVMAGGRWNASLSKKIGWNTKITTHRMHGVLTEEVSPILNYSLLHSGHRSTLTQMHNGAFKVVGGWPVTYRGAHVQHSLSAPSVPSVLQSAKHLFPRVSGLEVRKTWTSYMSAPIDDLPIVGPIPGCKNCFMIATTLMGDTLAPLLATTMAEWLLRQHVSMDALAFRADRPSLRQIVFT